MTEFITRNYGNESYEIIIKTDRNDHYRATEDFARRLIDHAKNMTNADRIRAMSDEELANYLFDVEQGNLSIDCCDDRFCDTQNCCHDCTEAAIKWLQQPVKG